MKIWKGKNIVTMNEGADLDSSGNYKWQGDSIVTDGGRIIDLGKYEDLLEKYGDLEVEDYSDYTILPGFIDPHSHFMGLASSYLQIPLDECYSIAEVLEKIKTHIDGLEDDGSWVFAQGYNQLQLKEKRHISAQILDEISKSHPVIVQQASGHSGVLNSKALDYFEIYDDTPNPEGGLIGKSDGKRNGFLEENAFIKNIQNAPLPSPENYIQSIKRAEKFYQENGITTMQEGYLLEGIMPLYEIAQAEKILSNDVIGYIDYKDLDLAKKKFPKALGSYDGNFKIAGFKMFLDGSPQGRTAWMREPYEGEKDYKAYGTMSDEEVRRVLEMGLEKNFQVLAHTNGDRAVEQYLDQARVLKEEGRNIEARRNVIIHGQLMGVDQLPEARDLNMIASFFAAHVYYYGDTHIENFGIERASKISPLKSALDNRLIFTLHQDSPVINPNMIESLWIACNRITSSGRVLGAEERIPVYEALKAITINGAYQYFEEDRKGSLEIGKLADMAILTENPLEYDLENLRDIEVFATVKNGEVVYRK